jgi:uncharacterized protein involved in type VI secretion and phage assembly
VGERFEGKLFVTAVQHQVNSGNWETVFQFGLNPEWFAQTYNVQQPMAAAMLPAIQGLQIGVVTRLEGDPDNEDRIMVRLPHISSEDEGIWSRISTLDAGAERGTFFRPENDDNHEKGYVSRSKMKLLFNDDKKTIHMETPSGNQVILSEDEKSITMQDEHGNKIVMNDSGITLESIKDIVLKATGDLKTEGVNINMKGSAQAKLEGSAGAELSSGGSLTIKGSIVQIN